MNIKNLAFLLGILLFANSSFAQSEIGYDFTFKVDAKQVKALQFAPEDKTDQNTVDGSILHLTDPTGNDIEFVCYKNNVMSQEMKRLYPDIVTLTAYATNHKDYFANVTIHGESLQAFILPALGKPFIIESVSGQKDTYISKFAEINLPFQCTTDSKLHGGEYRPEGIGGSRTSTNGATLRNYSFAIVITDEYEAANGAGATAIAVALNTINDLTTLYKKELSVTFTATVRPETGASNISPPGFADALYGGTVVSNYFSLGEYDLGQVFHNFGTGLGGAGQAYVGVVCNGGSTPPQKARSWSEGNPNNGSSFFGIVAHETAHMFSASHTFNSNYDPTCINSLSASTSYEPGAGSTIMSYSGICSASYTDVGQNLTDGSGNILHDSDSYFHVKSLEQMVAYIHGATGNGCATTSSTGNTPPTANANPCGLSGTISIPASTPFQLTGDATDSNGDALTYSWEQYNIGPPHGGPSAACASTTGPIFRSYWATSSPTRYFPSLQYILNNANVPLASVGECLPSVSRTLNFRLTVRDNNINGGGMDVSTIQLSVNSTVGPLAVTSPNTAVTYASGSSQTVTWSGFNSSSICNTMNILLSLDGGATYPYTLAANTPNDGSQAITIPSNIPASILARIKVESNCNACVKFFDVCNINFTITSACIAPQTTISPTTALTLNQGDPGLNLGMTNNLGSVVTQFTGTINTSDNAGSLVFLDNTPATCANGGNATFYDVILFSVNVTGSYTINHGGAFGTVINLYQNQFTGSNCVNHIASNATRPSGSGGISLATSLTATLTANTIYYIMVSGFTTSLPTHPFNYTITFPSKPAGSSIYNGVILPANYSYTYFAVNIATNLIVAVSATSNFITLPAGSYLIYGASYYSGPGPTPPTVIPTTWIGQTYAAILGANSCHTISVNSRNVNVVACSPIVSSQANSGVGSLRDVLACSGSGSTITFNSALVDTVFLTQPLVISSNVTIDGNNLVLIYMNFSGSFGINLTSAANTTFKNIKIRQVGSPPAAPVILNEGMLFLNGVEVKGNVNPVIRNMGAGSIHANNSVMIKNN